MGLGRFLLLGDFGQQFDLNDLNSEINSIKANLHSLRSRVDSDEETSPTMEKLQDEIDELRLYVAVLVRIISASELVGKEQFERILEAIDMTDGVVDGKFSGGTISP